MHDPAWGLVDSLGEENGRIVPTLLEGDNFPATSDHTDQDIDQDIAFLNAFGIGLPALIRAQKTRKIV